MPFIPVAALLSIGFLSVFIYFRLRSRCLEDVRGPPAPSFWLGNRYQMITQNDVGDCEFAWIHEYGAALRVFLPWGQDSLLLADPKALHHVLHASGYAYQRPREFAWVSELMVGNGVVAAETAETHKRRRKLLAPVFSITQLRTFFPFFQSTASRLGEKWMSEILASGGKDVNICKNLAKTTLDALGDAVFDYRFGALDDAENVVVKSLDNLFADSIMYPAKWDLLFKGLWNYLPDRLVKYYISHVPQKEYIRFKQFRDTAEEEAAVLVRSISATETAGNNTVMSMLVRANIAEDPNRRLSEKEILAQMATLILAGQETSASTMTWFLYELAKHPEDQDRLRKEIASTCEKTGVSTSREFRYGDHEQMPFLSACIKEVLRLHPIVSVMDRFVTRDDVIPLSTPIVSKSGKLMHEISISKGQNLVISIAAYNRLPSIWGADADEWKPTRFLDERSVKTDQEITLGVGYSNLLSFSAGVRGCIGWRFAVVEMQCILVNLIENFEFSPPNVQADIRRAFAGIMVPLVSGPNSDRLHEGVQMPLQLRPVKHWQ